MTQSKSGRQAPSPARRSAFQDRIRETLQHNHVSFAQLSRIDGFAGDWLMSITPEYPSIVLWAGMSEEAIDAIDQLRAEGYCHLHVAHPWVYLIDGGGLNLP